MYSVTEQKQLRQEHTLFNLDIFIVNNYIKRYTETEQTTDSKYIYVGRMTCSLVN